MTSSVDAGSTPPVLVEACVETLAEALAAEAGGAGRVELCADLAHEGTTPPDSLVRACVGALRIPVVVMVRPRPGGFVYDAAELATMLGDIRRLRALGAAAIVTGALDRAGRIDARQLAALLGEAAPLPVAFHRAFDAVADQAEALEQLVALGVARVLTAGAARTAQHGTERLAALVGQAGARIGILAGGGIRAHNVADLVRRTGVREVHGHFGNAEAVRAVVGALAG